MWVGFYFFAAHAGPLAWWQWPESDAPNIRSFSGLELKACANVLVFIP
jgi:hypothetical protein